MTILESAIKTFQIEAKAIQDLQNLLTEDFEKAIQLILKSKGRLVVCGMGKSGLIGKKISATLASTGTPSFFMHPAEAFHGDLGMLSAEDIILAISNSGETEELIRLIPSLRRFGNVLIAVTANKNSTLAKNSDFFLNIHVDEEACPLKLAPTSSTTATLVMGDAIAVALINERSFKPEDFASFHPGGSLGKKLLTKVENVMLSESLPIVGPDNDFKQILSAITKGRFGLAVVLENENIVGVITDGDLRRAIEKNDSFLHFKAKDLMSRNPKTISKNKMATEAEELMNNYKITSLLVEDNQKLVGITQIYNLNF